MSSLAKAIGVPQETLRLRQARVVATPSAGTCTIRFGGSNAADNISGVKMLGSASLANGSTVWVLQNGLDLLVLGEVSRSNTTWDGGATFGNGLELFHPGSTPYIDFHRAANAAGDSNADYNVRLINDAANVLALYGTGAQASTTGGLLHAGCAYLGSHPVHGGNNWAAFGNWNRQGASDYAFMQDNNGRTLVNCGTGDPRVDIVVSGTVRYTFDDTQLRTPNRRISFGQQVRDDSVLLYENEYMIGVRSSTLFLTMYDQLSADRRAGGATRMFDWNGNGLYLNQGWFRNNASNGFYIENQSCGIERGDGGTNSLKTYGTEARFYSHKNSQGGYASAGLESRGGSGSVPYHSWHAAGERASAIRKDWGGWNIVLVDQNANCCSGFAAGWGTCSDEARKTDISLADHYGLKSIRGLVPKRYRYHPVTEDQIWSTLQDRDERAAGKWRYRSGQQESWEQWHLGYMAEEVYNRVPEAAFLDVDDRPWAIDYGKLVVVAISALNELADRIEDLEAQVGRYERAAA